MHQKLFYFLTNLSSTTLFVRLLWLLFGWRLIIDIIITWMLKIYFYNLLLWAMVRRVKECILTSFQSCMLIAACWQVAHLRNTLSTFRIWTFKSFNLQGKFILLLFNDLLLVLWSEFWHAKLGLSIGCVIEIFFWKKCIWTNADAFFLKSLDVSSIL